MTKIQILDEKTANQIAAGEVVERPASIAKELVENSLDAGATTISVEIEAGGTRLCRVTDNGCGMSPEDAILALERHATSKISTASDLFRITSMGFRGEALPSIASVSRMELITREPGSLSGTRLVVEGGRLVENTPAGCPEGTRITVRDLFYNTPARLKYLKAPSTEAAQVADTVTRLALAHPDVAFRLISGGQVILSTPGSGKGIDALASALGTEVARQVLTLDYQDQSVSIQGFIGRPSVSRSGRSHQFIFVNRRPVRSLPLRYALEEAYQNLLPVQRYPVAVLFLEIDPAHVDVNVHPTKLELRFEREREIRSAVYRAVRRALQEANLIPQLQFPGLPTAGEGTTPGLPGGFNHSRASVSTMAADGRGDGLGGTPTPGVWAPPPGYTTQQMAAFWRESGPRFGEGLPQLHQPSGAIAPASHSGPVPGSTDESSIALRGEHLRALRPLGQVHRSYIIADSPEGLYIIDQHAAHERIYYERLLHGANSDKPPVQPLLFPVTLDLTPAQMAVWGEHRELLESTGFMVEPFGGKTLLVHGIPLALGATMAAQVVMDLIDRLFEMRGTGTDPMARRSELLAALAACKAAVKARESLSTEEMSALIEQLAACRSPATCPHGRPTMIIVSVSDLEKQFKRT